MCYANAQLGYCLFPVRTACVDSETRTWMLWGGPLTFLTTLLVGNGLGMVVHTCNTNTWGQRQKDQYDFEVGLVYTISSRLTQMAGPYSVSERGWRGWAEQSSRFSLLGSNASWSSSVHEFAAIGTLCHSGSRCRNKTPRRFLQRIGLCGCGAGEAHLNLQGSCPKSPELESGIGDGISEQS